MSKANPWSLAYLTAVLGFEVSIINRLVGLTLIGVAWIFVLRALYDRPPVVPD